MSRPRTESATDVERWFQQELARLWPAALGSLSLRRSPCVRQRCTACESGQQHLSHVLYGRRKGQRFALYVPDDLAPDVERALANGRRLQALLYEAGLRYARALKREKAQRVERTQRG
jgi:hypothetical protein